MSTTLSLVFCLVLLSAVMASTKIDSSLLETLNGGKTAKIRVSMTACPGEVKEHQEGGYEEYVKELTAYSARCQATVISLLETQKNRPSGTWEVLWPDQTLVNDADLKLVNDIAALENVAKIEEEKVVDLL